MSAPERVAAFEARLPPCQCGGQRHLTEREPTGRGYYISCSACHLDLLLTDAGIECLPTVNALLDTLELAYGEFVLACRLADGRISLIIVGPEDFRAKVKDAL